MAPTMMTACVLHGIGDLRVEQVPVPIPAADEVLLRVCASGVCGSDVQRIFEKGAYHFPTIPGHEFSGEVAAVPEGGDTALLGKKAAVFPLIPCRKCLSCEVGEYAQCADYDYYGSRRDGGFAEYLAVKTANLVLLPEAVSFEEAALCEPTAVAIHALSQVGVAFGDTVAIYGAGTIGVMLAKIARAWGAGRVVLIDIDPLKLAAARELGFSDSINSLDSDAPAEIMALTGGHGADVVVEGTGVSVALENCMKSARTFGRVVLMGNPIKDMTLPQKAYWEILRKQLTLKGTWNSSYNAMTNDWQNAVRAMPSLDLKPLITHRFPLSAGAVAIDVLRDKSQLVMKSMFIMD